MKIKFHPLSTRSERDWMNKITLILVLVSSVLVLASLDRLDITKGYETGNVQWVHKHANIMRNVYSIDYFIHLCHLVAEKHDDPIQNRQSV